MTTTSPVHQSVARRIVDDAVVGKATPGEIVGAINVTFNQLDHTMSEIIGVLGFRAVIGRAVQLSDNPFRWLPDEYAAVSKGGAADALAMAEREGPALVIEAAVSLLATVIGLLSNFIGDDLTLRLLSRVWPSLAGVAPARRATKE